MAVDEAVDEDRLRHVSWDPLLQHEGDPGSACPLDQASCFEARMYEEPLLGVETVVALRIGRLKEPVRQIAIGDEIKVGRGPGAASGYAGVGYPEAIQKGPEAVLVDDLFNGLPRRHARRELLHLQWESGNCERPDVGAGDE